MSEETNKDFKSITNYLNDQLKDLDMFMDADKQLDFHEHCLKLLEKSTNKVEELNKMLLTIEEIKTESNLDKSDVLKLLCELTLVLKNATEQNEKLENDEKMKQSEKFNQLFLRAEQVKNETEFNEAKEMGFVGTFDEFIKSLE